MGTGGQRVHDFFSLTFSSLPFFQRILFTILNISISIITIITVMMKVMGEWVLSRSEKQTPRTGPDGYRQYYSKVLLRSKHLSSCNRRAGTAMWYLICKTLHNAVHMVNPYQSLHCLGYQTAYMCVLTTLVGTVNSRVEN